jgi:hypothetical protein
LNKPVEDQYDPGPGAEPVPVPEPDPEPVPAPAPEPAPVPVPAPEPPGQYEPDPGTQAPIPETPAEDQYDPGAGGAVPPPAAPTDGQPPPEGPPVEEPAVQEELGVEPAPAPTEPIAPPPLDARASDSPGVPAPEEDVFVPAWASSLGAAISDATASLTGAVFGTFEAFANPPDLGPTLGGFWDLVGASLTESFFGGSRIKAYSTTYEGAPQRPRAGRKIPRRTCRSRSLPVRRPRASLKLLRPAVE